MCWCGAHTVFRCASPWSRHCPSQIYLSCAATRSAPNGTERPHEFRIIPVADLVDFCLVFHVQSQERRVQWLTQLRELSARTIAAARSSIAAQPEPPPAYRPPTARWAEHVLLTDLVLPLAIGIASILPSALVATVLLTLLFRALLLHIRRR